MCAALQALGGEPLELHAIDEVDAIMELGQDSNHPLFVERQKRLRNNEFFRDCLATSTVTLKVSDWSGLLSGASPAYVITSGFEVRLWVAML